jgi:hypothetical protein
MEVSQIIAYSISELNTRIGMWIVGAAFQPRSDFIAKRAIAAGKPLPHLKIKRPHRSLLLRIAMDEGHDKFVYRSVRF